MKENCARLQKHLTENDSNGDYGKWVRMRRNLHILTHFLLEMHSFPGTIFVFADVVFCRSVIDLCGDILRLFFMFWYETHAQPSIV